MISRNFVLSDSMVELVEYTGSFGGLYLLVTGVFVLTP